MTEPWEEEWEAVPRSGKGHLMSDAHEEEWATWWGNDNDSRGRLAAAAPDLYRFAKWAERRMRELRLDPKFRLAALDCHRAAMLDEVEQRAVQVLKGARGEP